MTAAKRAAGRKQGLADMEALQKAASAAASEVTKPKAPKAKAKPQKTSA